MKNSVVKDIVVLGIVAGVSYLVARRYRQQQQKKREMRESLHFQLF